MASIGPFVDKAYETKEFAELADAPVDALQGVSEGDAALLKSSLNIKTVRDLATNKYVSWAQGIAALSSGSGAVAGIPNLVDKAFEGKGFGDLASAPVDALQGVSANDAAALNKAFGIKTVGDLAGNKYVRWAQAIVALSTTRKA